MLTEERHQLILDTIKEKGRAKINELVNITNTSESTIRRDLTYLEQANLIKRVHGGATLLKGRFNEPSYKEKEVQSMSEKIEIAKYAASFIEEGDCIYLDAGTTTFEMIKYIDKRDVVIVTNGIKHINELMEKDINAYILGGKVKSRTRAVIGTDALQSLEKFTFDKAFIGINAIHNEYGFTTPDSEEAILKERAINYSREAFILADNSKFGEIAFVKVASLDKASIITDSKFEDYDKYLEKTKIKVVKK